MQIDRKNQDRVIKVTANALGTSVGDATAGIKEKLENYSLPAGYRLNYGGQSQMIAENMQQMAIILLFALFLGYAVMVLYFESFLKPFIIITSYSLIAGRYFLCLGSHRNTIKCDGADWYYYAYRNGNQCRSIGGILY
ncbi:MAG: efflux RND transporter permease subunit [Bacteroidales bacterium]|nr:efflux RND transporter permease subunit [Bacteroidales bacterium]